MLQQKYLKHPDDYYLFSILYTSIPTYMISSYTIETRKKTLPHWTHGNSSHIGIKSRVPSWPCSRWTFVSSWHLALQQLFPCYLAYGETAAGMRRAAFDYQTWRVKNYFIDVGCGECFFLYCKPGLKSWESCKKGSDDINCSSKSDIKSRPKELENPKKFCTSWDDTSLDSKQSQHLLYQTVRAKNLRMKTQTSDTSATHGFNKPSLDKELEDTGSIPQITRP